MPPSEDKTLNSVEGGSLCGRSTRGTWPADCYRVEDPSCAAGGPRVLPALQLASGPLNASPCCSQGSAVVDSAGMLPSFPGGGSIGTVHVMSGVHGGSRASNPDVRAVLEAWFREDGFSDEAAERGADVVLGESGPLGVVPDRAEGS